MPENEKTRLQKFMVEENKDTRSHSRWLGLR